MGSSKKTTQQKITNIRETSTTKIGDIGLTGSDAAAILQTFAKESSDTASQTNKTLQVTGANLSGALAKGFQALSTTAEGRERSAVARATGRDPASRDEQFGGFNITTAALVLAAVASSISIVRAL